MGKPISFFYANSFIMKTVFNKGFDLLVLKGRYEKTDSLVRLHNR